MGTETRNHLEFLLLNYWKLLNGELDGAMMFLVLGKKTSRLCFIQKSDLIVSRRIKREG